MVFVDCVVASNKFLVSDIARRVPRLNVRVINTGSLNRVVNPVGVLIIDLSEYEGIKAEFNHALVRVRSLASVIIGVLPSNDYEVYRCIDVHLCDDVTIFPFSPKDLQERIFNPKKPFINTLRKQKDFEAGNFEGVISNISDGFECEADLLYSYESLLIQGNLTKAEDIVALYYKTEKIPYHSKVKSLQGLIYGDSRSSLITTLKQSVKHFSDNPAYIFLLMVFGVDVDQRLIEDFNLTIPSSPIFLHNIPDFDMRFVNECLLKRKFESVFNFDDKEVISCSLLALKVKDYRFIKFIHQNIKKLPIPFLLQKVLKLMLEDEIEECRKLKHIVMFDFDNGKEHLNFLRLNYKKRGMQALIYQSSFILGIKDRQSRIRPGVENISEALKDNAVLDSYLLGQSFV
ncbi:hypothetical protein AB4428_01570 [Vibrio lentus]